MKTTLTLAFLLLAVSAFGQSSGQMRTVTSKASLIARIPVAGERVAVSTDYGGVRFFTSTTNLPSGGTNLAHVFASGVSNQWWVSDDKETSPQDVRWYGATGDGSTDDTVAIQAAIDSLPLPSTNSLFVERGGGVFIPDGTYKITAPLRMRPGKIEGGSRFGTVLINYGLTNDVIACMTPSNTPPTGIWLYRVAHMSIHQADATVPTAGAAIRVQSDDNATASMADVEDVFIHGTFRGFHGSALQGSSLKTLTVYATKDDGILWDVYQTMVQAIGCWTYYCGQNGTGHGWHLQGPAYCTVSASGADSNYGWGWYIEPGSAQNPVGGTYAVGGEQNAKGGMFIKGARGGIYTPMLVTKAGNTPPADGIVVDSSLSVTIAGGFTQQSGSGAIGYPLRVTNSITGYPSVTLSGSYINSYFDGTNYHQFLGEVNSFAHEERGFLGLRTDGIPRRMLDIHDRTGAAGNSTGHELARLALHTSDTNGNAFISLSPDGEGSFFKIIANNPSTNTVFNVGTNADVVFHAPGAPLSGDGGSFLFQIDDTPVMTLKGGDTLGAMGIGTTRPNPAALLDVRSRTRGILLPSWEATEFESGLYGSGQYTPPGLLAYDSDARSIRVQTRNSDDGLTNNQWTSLFGYVGRDLRLGTAHRLIGTIFPQSIHATDTNIGSVYLSFTAEGTAGLELEQNSFRAGPYQYGTFGDTLIRNSYAGSAGAYGNLRLMAGDNASLTIGNGTARGTVTISNDLVVADTITLGGVARSSWPSAGSGTNTWKIEINTTEVTEPDITDTSTIGWTAVGSTVSAAVKTGSLGTNSLTGAAYAALKDLGSATGTLAGSAVGSGINDDNVDFDDVDGLWTATTLGAALEELNDSINAGSPNGTGAKVHWSQLLGVPAGFADGTDDGTGGGGTGDVVGPASSTDSVVALYDGTTGKLLKDGTLTEAAINAHLTEAEASALYQRTNSFLTGLSTGDGSALTNLNASNLASGTVASNRLPAAIALTTIDAGTITATSVTGDGSGLTNLNGSNIASGTVADARIDSAITRDSEAAAAYQPLDADLTTLAINNGVNLTNINATIAFGTGTIPDARIGAAVARTNSPTLHSPSLLGDPTAPTASANDNDTSIATTAYVQAEETALKAANLWQATNANLTTLAGASITGSGNFMRTRTGVPREIWIPASAMNPGSDAPTPATNAWNTTTDGQRWEGWDFSATATNSVFFLLALPTAWDGGTVKAKILWKQVVAAATATNSWQIGGGSITDGETGGNTLGTLVEVLDVGANDTNVVSVSAASGAITIGGTPSAGHLTWFTVRRHPGDDDDNFAQLSRLIGVHLQYIETSTEPSAW